jgi:Tol biopolymer transport system component
VIRPIHLCVIALALSFAFLSACSETPPRPAAKFAGRLLLLSGTGANGADLIELTPNADGKSYNLSTIANGVAEATASADQTELLYSTKSEIGIRDLHNRANKSIIKSAGYCLTWSPDAKRFSYKEKQGVSTKLYVSDLEGKTKLIWEDTSGVEHDAVRYCAQWVAPDRIVFDRFVGMTPKQANSEGLKPNTTTVATVGDSIKFVDGERKWSIQGTCPSGNVLVAPADQAQPTLVAKTTDNFAKLNPTPASSEGRFIGFAARSCVPFFISQSLSTTTDLFSLNPTNWQRLRTTTITYTFSLNAKFLIKSSAKLMVAGDAPDKLLLIDTESGDVTPLAIAGDAKLSSPVPIVWIEG